LQRRPNNQAHSGSIWKVTWAHPEFGQLLASCSLDRTVIIWEEVELGHWEKRATLVDFNESVVDVQFAPKHTGLKLATCALDGTVRIYQATDIMSLAHWSPTDELDTKGKASCVCWDPSPFGPESLVVGTQDGHLRTFEFQEPARRWQLIAETTESPRHSSAVHDVAWAPNMGRTFQLIASAGADGTVRIWHLVSGSAERPAKAELRHLQELVEHGKEVWAVEWNITGTILSSSGDDGNVRLWRANLANEWKQISVITVNADK